MGLRRAKTILLCVFLSCLALTLIGFFFKNRLIVLLGVALLFFLYLPLNLKLWRCPHCGSLLGSGKPDFCPRCGGALDYDL